MQKLAESTPVPELSLIVPVFNEEHIIERNLDIFYKYLNASEIVKSFEILVINDGSSDDTWRILQDLREKISNLAPLKNTGQHGFGRAVICGMDAMKGDTELLPSQSMSTPFVAPFSLSKRGH